jgi:hypothetical protein
MAHVLPRALDDWRVAYWPRPLDRSACAAMAEKYAALAALVLWADLHPLLADQLRWRAAGGRGGVAGFCRFAAADAAGRWPGPELLTAAAGAAVRPRQAYLWLAAQAGMPLPALNLALLGRPGHWDRRPGDPPGSA